LAPGSASPGNSDCPGDPGTGPELPRSGPVFFRTANSLQGTITVHPIRILIKGFAVRRPNEHIVLLLALAWALLLITLFAKLPV
jgi:hypothetical protein